MRTRKTWRVRVFLNERLIGRVIVQNNHSPFKAGSGDWRDFAFEYHLRIPKGA